MNISIENRQIVPLQVTQTVPVQITVNRYTVHNTKCPRIISPGAEAQSRPAHFFLQKCCAYFAVRRGCRLMKANASFGGFIIKFFFLGKSREYPRRAAGSILIWNRWRKC